MSPPESADRFIRNDNWLLLDSWSDNGTYHTGPVTREENRKDGSCANMLPLRGVGRRRRCENVDPRLEPPPGKARDTHDHEVACHFAAPHAVL
jgi:hypothetical protein